MEVSSLLTDETAAYQRQSDSAHRVRANGASRTAHNAASANSLPKKVAFELLLDAGSKNRARIPMRVLINTHDTTDSIVTTVKNFYGIYEGHGVRFEDEKGDTLIANYDNFTNDMVVYVRTVAGPQPPPHHAYQLSQGLEAQKKTSLGEPFQMLPPHHPDYSHSPSRPTSRLARKRSISPQLGRGRRSASQQKSGVLSNTASRGSSAHGSHHDEGYSDSDGGQSSLAGSRKARSEQFASADISIENVLQDGRRKGPSFESSVGQPCGGRIGWTDGRYRYANVCLAGTAIVCPSTSPFDHIDFVHLSSATIHPPRGSFSLCSTCPEAVATRPPTFALSTAQRLQ